MILRLVNKPMTSTERVRLSIFIDSLIAIAVFLLFAGLGFQIYSFRVYQETIRENRVLLCATEALKHEAYCWGVPTTPKDVNRARARVLAEAENGRRK